MATTAFAFLTIGMALALAQVIVDRRLRSRRPLGWLKILTPLESLESGCFQSILAGFLVLTLALVSGAFFVENLFAQHLVHKVTLALVAWFVFGVLLLGPIALRLARQEGAALDLRRLHVARAVLFRQQADPRKRARQALGLSVLARPNARRTHGNTRLLPRPFGVFLEHRDGADEHQPAIGCGISSAKAAPRPVPRKNCSSARTA